MDGQTDRQTDRTRRQTIALASTPNSRAIRNPVLISAASFVIESNPCSDASCTKVPQSCFIKLTHQFHETTHDPLCLPRNTHTHTHMHIQPAAIAMPSAFRRAFNETRQKVCYEKLPTRQKFNWNWMNVYVRGEEEQNEVAEGGGSTQTMPVCFVAYRCSCWLINVARHCRNNNLFLPAFSFTLNKASQAGLKRLYILTASLIYTALFGAHARLSSQTASRRQLKPKPKTKTKLTAIFSQN